MTEPLTGVLRCPCGTAVEYIGWSIKSTGELLFKCPQCNAVVHRVAPGVAVYSPADKAHADSTWPQSGSWQWVGLVKGTDGVWVATALTDTLSACWDALDSSWLRGDRVCFPVRSTDDSDAHETEPGQRHVTPPPGRWTDKNKLAVPPETCARCKTPTMTVHWRTLANGRKALWSRCSTCRGGGRAMPHLPGYLAEASQRRRWEDA